MIMKDHLSRLQCFSQLFSYVLQRIAMQIQHAEAEEYRRAKLERAKRRQEQEVNFLKLNFLVLLNISYHHLYGKKSSSRYLQNISCFLILSILPSLNFNKSKLLSPPNPSKQIGRQQVGKILLGFFNAYLSYIICWVGVCWLHTTNKEMKLRDCFIRWYYQ